MFQASKAQLNWILKQEDSQGSRGLGLSLSSTKAEHRKCVLAEIIEERVNRILEEIERDEENGFVPSGSLALARRELGYTDC